jgi:hypothetical protein
MHFCFDNGASKVVFSCGAVHAECWGSERSGVCGQPALLVD